MKPKTELMCLPGLQGMLGACCDCGEEFLPVQHVVLISMRSLEPGHGCWGCVACNLPQAGAIAVLCDQCAKTFNGSPLNVCLGSPDQNRRTALANLTEPFDHDRTKHDSADSPYGLFIEGALPGDIGKLVEQIADKLGKELSKFLDLEIKRERHNRN